MEKKYVQMLWESDSSLFNKLKKEDIKKLDLENIPDNIIVSIGENENDKIYYQLDSHELDINSIVQMRQLKYVKTIKNCAVLFTVIYIIGIFLALIFFTRLI